MSDLVFGANPITDVEADSTCVIFEARSGRIRHTHRVVTLRGGRHPDTKEMVRVARDHLQQAGGDLTGLNEIIVDSVALDTPGMISVDVATGGLVSRPLPGVAGNRLLP